VMCNWIGKVGLNIETHSILPPLKSFKLKWAWISTMFWPFQRHIPFCSRGRKRPVCSWEIHNPILLQIPQNSSSSRVEATKPCSEAVELSNMVKWLQGEVVARYHKLKPVFWVYFLSEFHVWYTDTRRLDCCELSLHCKD
jgi:hypothetical protein